MMPSDAMDDANEHQSPWPLAIVTLAVGMLAGFGLASIWMFRLEADLQRAEEVVDVHVQMAEKSEKLLVQYREDLDDCETFSRGLATELLQWREKYGNEFKSPVPRDQLLKWTQ